jgi:glycosyltransferase involved in cell wall biosynthesis
MNIVVVAHKFLTQPDDELILYLNEKKYKNVIHITHSFSDAVDRKSYFRIYESGKIKSEIISKDYRNFPEPLIYLKELIFTMYHISKLKIIFDQYIGMDGMCSLFGLLLKKIGKTKRVIYWCIDFVPENRFKQEWKNKIYRIINVFSLKNSDEVWDLSPRMAEAREKFLGIRLSNYKFHKVVPYGIWTKNIKRLSYEEIDPYTIVFMGHLLEKQGVQLVLKALPELIKKFPKVKFKIIGGGAYKHELIKLSKNFKVEQYCQFLGKIENIREVEREISNSIIAVAPYMKSLDTWTYYADPGKIKTYLGCGVPVILTNISWNAAEIQEKKCGIVIEETVESLVNAVTFLLDKKNNSLYRSNAIKYSESFNYSNIFKDLDL